MNSRILPVVFLSGVLFASEIASAKNGPPGRLIFLGKTSDASRSVWLSLTSNASSFELQTLGQQVVDEWMKSARGARLTLSPFVSTGSGGTHFLLDVGGSKPLQIDSQNQKGGFTFPPYLQVPPWLPPFLKPPHGGGEGGEGGSPPTTLPGVVPQLPPGVKPPTGLMPTKPGGVQPPIGTLPPSGITPERPTRPPTGLMPTKPGGVQPPIGTLPPSGITPERPTRPPTGLMPTKPGGVEPPIAKLPPSGLTPERPTRPPTGLMPTRPGGVQPPLATLPPGNLTPGVRPPTGQLPPGGRPAGPDGGRPSTGGTPSAPNGVVQPGEAGTQNFGQHAPLGPGREFGIEPQWNLWSDARFLSTSDRRHGLDRDGQGVNLTIGGDRRLSDRVVLGLMVSLEDFWSSGFQGRLEADSKAFTIGPYIDWQVAPAWVIEGSFGYGRSDNENRLLIFDSEYTTERYTGSLSATGQYAVGAVNLRPKLSVSFTHFWSEAYDMTGQIGRFPIKLPRGEDGFDSGVAETTVEINHVFQTRGGTAFVPYVELGVSYEFVRANDGKILTGDLTTAATSAWSGTIRAGARALLTRSFFVEASAGYLSIGQHNLDTWEGRLFLSHAF